MYKCLEINNILIYFPSISSHKCTPSDWQMYPQGYMYPRLGTPGLEVRLRLLVRLKLH